MTSNIMHLHPMSTLLYNCANVGSHVGSHTLVSVLFVAVLITLFSLKIYYLLALLFTLKEINFNEI